MLSFNSLQVVQTYPSESYTANTNTNHNNHAKMESSNQKVYQKPPFVQNTTISKGMVFNLFLI